MGISSWERIRITWEAYLRWENGGRWDNNITTYSSLSRDN